MSDLDPQLVHVALRSGMIDASDLAILDPAQRQGDPVQIVNALKAAKPNLFRKQATEMTPAERAAAIAEAKANPRPAPARTAPAAAPRTAEPAEPAAPPAAPRSAMTMLLEERAAFLREHAKKFPTEMQHFSLPRKSPYQN